MQELAQMTKEERLERMRHSAAHIMAEAVCEMFPDARLGIGPPIDTGFYYDFDLPRPLTTEDLPVIEEKMRARIDSNVPFEPSQISKDEARQRFADQPYKLELIDEIARTSNSAFTGRASSSTSARARTSQRTGEVLRVQADERRRAPTGAATSTTPCSSASTARSSTRRRSSRNTSQRIEEAARRDHRRLGRELDLFSFHEEFGPGLVYWHPKGGRARTLIEDFWREEHFRAGLRRRLLAAHRQVDALGDQRPPELLRREHVLADGHRRAGLLREADELPVPHPDLQERSTQLPRAADPHGRAGHRLPLRALGRAPRPPPRARLHPGRRAHLLPAGPGEGRDRALRRLHALLPGRVRLRAVPRLPVDARRDREVRRLARGLGDGDERPP